MQNIIKATTVPCLKETIYILLLLFILTGKHFPTNKSIITKLYLQRILPINEDNGSVITVRTILKGKINSYYLRYIIHIFLA